MKKLLLSLVAVALVAMSASAAKVSFKPTHNAGQATTAVKKAPKMNVEKARSLKKAGLKAAEDFPIITEAPEGTTEYIFKRTGSATLVYFIWSMETVQDNMALRAYVDLANMKVYIKDPVSNYATGALVEGNILVKDGQYFLEVPLGQNLLYSEDYDAATQLWFLNGVEVEEDGETYISYEVDRTTVSAVYSLDLTTMTVELLGGSNAEGEVKMQSEMFVLGSVWSDDDSWTGYSDWDSEYTLFNDKPVEGPAETLEPETWYVSGTSYSGDAVTYPCNVVIDGADIYVQGVMADLPEGWIKGTIEDGVATFAGPQYMGITEGNWFIYATGATDGEEDDFELANPITFAYDAEAKCLTLENDYLLFNCSDTDIDGYDLLANGTTISFIEDKEAMPAAPEFSYVGEYDPDYGYGYASIYQEAVDEDGNLILPDKLYYQFWKEEGNEKSIVEFNPDEYMYLIDPMTEIPYAFSDDYDFNNFGKDKTIYLNFDYSSWDGIGVQAIYYGGDVRTESKITWYELSGVEDVTAAKSVASAIYYDLTGRRVAKPAQGGVYVKSVKYTDGTAKNFKVLVK